MRFSAPLFLSATLAALPVALPEPAKAQVAIGGDFRIHQRMRDQERRHRYRPNIHVSRGPGGAKTFRSGTSIPYEFRTRQGFVSKIEIRSGLKVIKTIYPGHSSSGRGRVTLKASDFARVGKAGPKMKFRIWAWQGRTGFQSVHGESPLYSLVP